MKKSNLIMKKIMIYLILLVILCDQLALGNAATAPNSKCIFINCEPLRNSTDHKRRIIQISLFMRCASAKPEPN
jgi:hypothetical protein